MHIGYQICNQALGCNYEGAINLSANKSVQIEVTPVDKNQSSESGKTFLKISSISEINDGTGNKLPGAWYNRCQANAGESIFLGLSRADYILCSTW